jgi:hypothetical protein
MNTWRSKPSDGLETVDHLLTIARCLFRDRLRGLLARIALLDGCSDEFAYCWAHFAVVMEDDDELAGCELGEGLHGDPRVAQIEGERGDDRDAFAACGELCSRQRSEQRNASYETSIRSDCSTSEVASTNARSESTSCSRTSCRRRSTASSVVSAASPEEAAARLEEDPWTTGGVLETRSVERWEVLVGEFASG